MATIGELISRPEWTAVQTLAVKAAADAQEARDAAKNAALKAQRKAAPAKEQA